jgi:LPXTG-motif cell wall-anchored protein
LRKVMLLAAMLAMVLAAAAPALSQTAVGGDVAVLQYSCDQIQAAVNTQYQQGEGVGAVAGAAQSLGIDQQQVLACFGTAAAAQDSVINIGTAGAAKTVTATAKGGGGSASAAAGGELPSTGGASLIALGAGALLVAGGLLARRIVR